MKWIQMVIFSTYTVVKPMNYIDMFVWVVLIYAVFMGFRRGLVMQLTLLAAFIAGIFCALKFSGLTADLLEKKFNMNPEYIYLVSLGITFALVFILVNIAGRLTQKFIEAVELSFFNRILGTLFSIGKTILIVGVLLAYVDRIDRRAHFLPDGTREHSIFFSPLSKVACLLFP